MISSHSHFEDTNQEKLYRLKMMMVRELSRKEANGVPLLINCIRRTSQSSPQEILKLAARIVPSSSSIEVSHKKMPIVIDAEQISIQSPSPSLLPESTNEQQLLLPFPGNKDENLPLKANDSSISANILSYRPPDF